ncbi:MAG TPA: hypothetical protein VFW98_07915 [Gemmatimonadaceae bacterium]|nr:hypothetical protein [Gemmatimonadaceae bacterium]
MAIFTLAFTVRLVLVLVLHLPAHPEHAELEKIAASLAEARSFANPYSLPTGPTAHHAPIYPFLLSLIYRLVGTGAGGSLGECVFNITCVALSFALLPIISSAITAGPRIGTVAGALGALLPVCFMDEARGGYAPLVVIILEGLFLLTLSAWRRRAFTAREAIGHGVLWGVALLVSPSLLPVLLGFLLVAGVLLRRRPGRAIRFGALLATSALVTMAPWGARNVHELGALVLTRDNFGLELQVSNNPLARPTLAENEASGAFHTYHPFANPAEARRVRALGEVRYDRAKLHTALDWIGGHPSAFARLTLRRAWEFWFPAARSVPGTALPATALLWLVTVLGLAGLGALARRDGLSAALIAVIWAGYPLVYYVVQADARYRYPVYWSLLVVGAWWVGGVARATASVQHVRWIRRNGRQKIAAREI